jgi:3-hydroxyacyl-[acyl-carrier-protein] dehydratase
LLVDEIVEQSSNRIVCRKRFTGHEFWFAGHYPQFPLTPGVLLVEAAMQAGAVLLAKHAPAADGGVPVATRINHVKFKAMVLPGDTIEMEVELVERVADAFFLDAKVTSGGKTAATFDFACKMARPR